MTECILAFVLVLLEACSYIDRDMIRLKEGNDINLYAFMAFPSQKERSISLKSANCLKKLLSHAVENVLQQCLTRRLAHITKTSNNKNE